MLTPSGFDQIPRFLRGHSSKNRAINAQIRRTKGIGFMTILQQQFKIPIARDLARTDPKLVIEGFKDVFAVIDGQSIGTEFYAYHNTFSMS
jgi:hypothetical protein